MRVLWVTQEAKSGATSQTEMLRKHFSDHSDIDEFCLMKGRPLNIDRSETWIEGERNIIYPTNSIEDAIDEWDPDICMIHIMSKRLHKAITETNPEIAWMLRLGANFTENMLSGQGNLNQLGPLIDLCNAVDHIITASPRTADQTRAFGIHPGDMTTIPTVHDFQNLEEPKPKPDRIGVLGRLERVKNQPVIVQALSILEQRGWEITAKFAGNPSGDKIERILQQIGPKMGIAECEIEWTGYIDPIDDYWPEVSIHCQPSWTEHSPSSVIEAANHGVPAILSDLEWSEPFGHPYERADPDNPVQWADLIEYYLKNEDFRVELAKSQQEYLVDHYHVEDWIPEYIKAFEKTLSDSDIIVTP